MQIRPVHPEEASTLTEIALASKAFWGYSAAQLAQWREDLSPSAASIREQPTFVAEIDGAVAGFYQINLSAEPVELDHLWVDPRFMRQGVGRALISHATATMAQRGIAQLLIDSEPHAEAFYLAMGAMRIGERAAPIVGEPLRIRPQLRLATG